MPTCGPDHADLQCGGHVDCPGVLVGKHQQHQHAAPSGLQGDPPAYGLGSQLAVCARAKAMEAIKAEAKQAVTCPTFGPRGAVRYDAHTFRLMSLDRVSLAPWGRVQCQMLPGTRQHALAR